mgnify:FL=1
MVSSKYFFINREQLLKVLMICSIEIKETQTNHQGRLIIRSNPRISFASQKSKPIDDWYHHRVQLIFLSGTPRQFLILLFGVTIEISNRLLDTCFKESFERRVDQLSREKRIPIALDGEPRIDEQSKPAWDSISIKRNRSKSSKLCLFSPIVRWREKYLKKDSSW